MLVEIEWDLKFPNMKLKALSSRISYHTSIMLELESNISGPKPFQSLDARCSHLEFTKMVNQEWQMMGRISIVEKFINLRSPLRRWNRDIFANIDSNIAKFEKGVAIVELKVKSEGVFKLAWHKSKQSRAN